MEDATVTITIEDNPSIPNLKIITIGGNFDALASPQVDEKVLTIIEHEKSNFILNLSQLIYLSSVGLMRLLKYLQSITDQERLLKLVKPPNHIYSMFVVAGIAKYFDMSDSIEEAIGSF